MHAKKFSPAFLLLALVVLLSSPGQAKEPDVWKAYASNNFIIYTDDKPKKAKEILEKFETFRQVALTVLGYSQNADAVPVKIVYFADRGEFNTVTDSTKSIGSMIPTEYGPFIAVSSGTVRQKTAEVLFHEYVHYLMYYKTSFSYPTWYGEGMAEFFETSRVKRGEYQVGVLSKGNVNTFKRLGMLPTSQLISPPPRKDWSDEFAWRFYAQAWATTHFLQLGPFTGAEDLRPQLHKYLKLYNAGVASDDAFEQAFDISSRRMDKLVLNYLKARIPSAPIPVKEVDYNIRELATSNADIQTIIGDMSAVYNDAEVPGEYYSRALAEDPGNHKAIARQALLAAQNKQTDKAVKAIEALLESLPNDPDTLALGTEIYYYAVSQAAKADDSAGVAPLMARLEQLADAASKANPHLAAPHMYLSFSYYNGPKDVPRAVRSMLEAKRLMPWMIRINYVLGYYLSETSHTDEARKYLTKVANWNHGGGWSSRAQKRLAEMDAELAASN